MISFVGLGKLGLPLATCFAKRGVDVLAVDRNSVLIDTLGKGKVPWKEVGLDTNLSEAEPHIKYSKTYEGVENTDTTIILVNTPSNKADGSFSNVYVEQTILSICESLDPERNLGHHFILSSTVMPRTINKTLIPLIENALPWSIARGDFGFSFVPDFVALGTIIDDFENPDFLLIGSSAEKYGLAAHRLYMNIVANGTPVSFLSLAEAELAKVSLNAYITTKISFANFLKLYAERSSEQIDPVKVAMAIGQDSRIGRKYFRPGGPYGGTCFPRDTWAFARAAEDVGLRSQHMVANEEINDTLVDDLVVDIVKSKLRKVILLGAAFKVGTAVVTQGVAEKLAERLRAYNFDVGVVETDDQIFANFNIEGVRRSELSAPLEDAFYVICNADYAGEMKSAHYRKEAF